MKTTEFNHRGTEVTEKNIRTEEWESSERKPRSDFYLDFFSVFSVSLWFVPQWY
jgi:hypothetical protein